MPVQSNVLEVLRMYKQNIPPGVIATRLRQLWNSLTTNQKNQLNNFLDQGLLAQLFLQATLAQINIITDDLTSAQKQAVFNIIKADLVSFFQTENDDEIDLVNNTTIE